MDRHPSGIGHAARFRGWRPTKGAATLIALCAAIFVALAMVLGSPAWIGHLLLVPERALGREPWQLLTGAFIHPDVRSLVFNGIGIWFFGSMVEEQLGRSRMLLTFLVGAVGGSIAAAFVGRFIAPGLPILAYTFGTSALLAAVGVVNWSTPLRVFGAPPVRGRWVALVLIALATVPLFLHSRWIDLAGTLGALGFGALSVSSGLWSGLHHRWERLLFWRVRRRYRVISGGRDPRSYMN